MYNNNNKYPSKHNKKLMNITLFIIFMCTGINIGFLIWNLTRRHKTSVKRNPSISSSLFNVLSPVVSPSTTTSFYPFEGAANRPPDTNNYVPTNTNPQLPSHLFNINKDHNYNRYNPQSLLPKSPPSPPNNFRHSIFTRIRNKLPNLLFFKSILTTLERGSEQKYNSNTNNNNMGKKDNDEQPYSPNILIGIMTNQNNLRDRALGILRTWGNVCTSGSDGTTKKINDPRVKKQVEGVKLVFMGEREFDPSQEFCIHSEPQHHQQPNLKWENEKSRKPNYFPPHVSNCTANVWDHCFVSLQEVHPGVIEYPPMTKAFAMFRYMYEHYVLEATAVPANNNPEASNHKNQYGWFIRVDDDVYVKLAKLRRFLNSLDPNKLYYIGQMGIGRKTDKKTQEYFAISKKLQSAMTGTTALLEAKNFCMGGTGIIMSRAVLASIGPHITECLNQTVSVHDDVEIGRCIYRYAHQTECSWSYEGSNLFFNNYKAKENVAVTYPSTAIVIHPLKNVRQLYELHRDEHIARIRNLRKLIDHRNNIFFSSSTKKGKSAEQKKLVNDQITRSSSGIKKYYSGDLTIEDIPVYSAIIKGGKVLQTGDLKNPHISLAPSWRYYLQDVTLSVFAKLRALFDMPYDPNKLPNIPIHMYIEWQPASFSTNNILLEASSRFSSNHRIKCMVGETVYSADFKSTLEYHELDYIYKHEDKLLFKEIVSSQNDNNYTSNSLMAPPSNTITPINLIIPFSKRYETMSRFLNLYESICLRGTRGGEGRLNNNIAYPVTLNIIAFINDRKGGTRRRNARKTTASSSAAEIDINQRKMLLSKIVSINKKYKASTISNNNNYSNRDKLYRDKDNIKIHFIYGRFSRALALEYGATLFESEDLLVFLDVDMVFDQYFLYRARTFTKPGVSAYFPIVYSQYKNKTAATPTLEIPPLLNFYSDGFWNIYGYGMAAIFKSDFDHSGGFNMDIRGWGKEDVDLYTKILRNTNLTVYRAPEPGLVHVYHKRHCPVSLESSQYKMCLDSMASYEANRHVLAQTILKL